MQQFIADCKVCPVLAITALTHLSKIDFAAIDANGWFSYDVFAACFVNSTRRDNQASELGPYQCCNIIRNKSSICNELYEKILPRLPNAFALSNR